MLLTRVRQFLRYIAFLSYFASDLGTHPTVQSLFSCLFLTLVSTDLLLCHVSLFPGVVLTA